MSVLSVSIVIQNQVTPRIVAAGRRGIHGSGPRPAREAHWRLPDQRPCDNPRTMQLDDRFDELVASLSGFHRTWLIYLGVELGLFSRLRAAGRGGLTADQLAAATGCHPVPIAAWVAAADAHGLAELDGDRLTLDDDTAIVLLDDTRPEFLGGQFVHAVIASLDWAGMLDFFRTGEPLRERPDRYRTSIERLTVQDVAVFFQEALAELPQLVADLSAGGRVVDIHCGGGRWLIAMARRFPAVELVGVEFEPDSVERARANVAGAGFADRIAVRQGGVDQVRDAGGFDLAYFQYALHQLADPVDALRAAWAAMRPGGRLVVLDWPLPSSVDEFRSRHGELVAGVQLDELYQGTTLATRERYAAWFAAAGLPSPITIDLASGASLFVAEQTPAPGAG
jgi:SAM-dependent methyltransferase